ncbi:MAG: hypothetical protein AB7G17_09855 [Phycisphaerales bacterium]
MITRTASMILSITACASAAHARGANGELLTHLNTHALMETMAHDVRMLAMQTGRIAENSTLNWNANVTPEGWNATLHSGAEGDTLTLHYTANSAFTQDGFFTEVSSTGTLGKDNVLTNATALWQPGLPTFTSMLFQSRGGVETSERVEREWLVRAAEVVGGGVLGGLGFGLGGAIAGAGLGLAISDIWLHEAYVGNPNEVPYPSLPNISDWNQALTFPVHPMRIRTVVHASGDASFDNGGLVTGVGFTDPTGFSGTITYIPSPGALALAALCAVPRRRR